MQELAVIQLFRGYQIDLERQPQIGAERVGEVAGKEFVQLADGPELLLGDTRRLPKIALGQRAFRRGGLRRLGGAPLCRPEESVNFLLG